MDSRETQSNSASPEIKEVGTRGIHLEFGIHSNKSRKRMFTTVEEDLHAGYLDSHTWNPAVASRMDYEPSIISIDGLFAGMGDYTDKEKAKERVWRLIPERPKKFNKRGELLVVAGDLSYDESRPPELKPQKPDFDKKENQQIRDIQKESYLDTLPSLAATVAFAAVLMAAPESKLTRRKFLKRTVTAGLLTSGAYTVSSLAPFIAALSPDRRASYVAEEITKISFSVFSENNWLSGRTALMIAKCDEARLQGVAPVGSEAAVVMGSNHAVDANYLLHSREKRIKAISRYYSDLVDFMEKIYQKYPNIPKPKEEAIKYIEEILPRADMFIVSDSGEKKATNIEDFINRNVHFVGIFQSQEVREAINRAKREKRENQNDSDQVRNVKIF
jgi:hypothetical protein